MLKIRQSYHGSGGREGYKFKVYNDKDRKLGEIRDFPSRCNVGDVVKLNGQLYEVAAEYDSDNPRHEKTEVMFFELEPYTLKPDFDLGNLIKS